MYGTQLRSIYLVDSQTMKPENTKKLEKRAAALRDNLKRRKAKAKDEKKASKPENTKDA